MSSYGTVPRIHTKKALSEVSEAIEISRWGHELIKQMITKNVTPFILRSWHGLKEDFII